LENYRNKTIILAVEILKVLLTSALCLEHEKVRTALEAKEGFMSFR
jgi:hypothetical protein